MASSLFTNTLHVCFDSVLSMDNPGMVSTFEALMASGLSGFLGCPAVLYEDALIEFFLNGSVRDGKVVSTIRGKQVEISEELFAISTSDKKREMKFEFCLLSDILAKTISVKAGSFDAVTQERFLMMEAITCGVAINWNRLLFNIFKDMVTAGSRQAKGYAIQISLLLENVPNLELGDSSEFPSSKILTKKTVHRYIAVNDKVAVEEVTDVPRVKKTPVKKAVSRKRPAAVDEPIVKKKRTPVGKAAVVATDSALEAVPIQVVAPISTVPPPAPKRKIEKRKRRLALGSDDEIVGEPTTVAEEVAIENIVEEQRIEMPVDPVDQIIEQVIAETAQVETDVGRTNDSGPDVEDQGVKTADETELWFNLSYEEFATTEANRPVETGSDTEEEFVTEKGSDDKKRKDSSSLPQPHPDDQNRPSGGNGSRADDPRRSGGDTVSREGANIGGDGRRRGDSSGSPKRRRYDSDDKKGEGSSSRPQLPPDDQNRPSGGNGSRADDPRRSGGDTVSREGANIGGDGRRRGDSSGSPKRRRYDSGGGSGGRINYGPYLPPKRDDEYWISGKRQF
ncbi:patatin-like protein 2 [Dorcoceras hygrometricum]|uniref:Patatin-like protein 2 n=1 Tax=Dorcoceras hygrometricum TaxID=472368 RepID=A0A2Z7D4M9_9LAMI|nr:patatin-like protein 2 [Dorcoceras hygrometricum]